MIALLCVSLAACNGDDDPSPTPTRQPTATASPTATTTPGPTPTPFPAIDTPPDRDPIDLARRFLGLPDSAPLVARTEPHGHQVGDQVTFTLLDLDIPAPYEIAATVQAVSENAYFFVQNGRSNGALNTIVSDFENEIWPAVTAAFGEPTTPGVDGDPRITILHADLRGAGGYVSGADQYPKAIAPRSNEREMLYIDAENLTAPGVPYNGLVAHELQHLIHERYDDGEESWVNEGLSQVAGQLLGETGNWIPNFLANPDLQLTDWPLDGDIIAHYAAAELFFSYVLDHYGGRDNANALLSAQEDGIEGVDEYLEDFDTSFADVFADWTVANWLDANEGPYAHPTLSARTSVSTNANGPGEGTVSQFGADYLRIPAGSGEFFAFEGATEVSIGVPEYDGPFYWSNRGDSIDSCLTRTFDLSHVDSATLTFQTWYQIENGWDYAYIAASTDAGATWTALSGSLRTTDNPTGQSYGPAFTGSGGGWTEETIDLTPYARNEVVLRFEYITDDAANEVGFAVDNIAVPEIGFFDDGTDDGWAREGFLRIDGPLQQEWSLMMIADDGVQPLAVDNGAANVLLGDAAAVIVVAAITPGTTEPAAYSWSFSQ